MLAVAGGFTVKALWPHDTATVVEAEEALDRFRNTTTSVAATTTTLPDAPPLELPLPGVYRYATTGAETVDILGGATHTYPAETLLTVTSHGCGVQLRWDLLEERREEWRLCVTRDGIEFQATAVQYHEFFENGRTEQMVCHRDVVVVRDTAAAATTTAATDTAAAPPGTAEAVTCLLDGRPWDPVWEHLGTEDVTVGGTAVAATHVRMTVDMPGDHYEHTVIDWWLAPSGLPLRMTATKESKTDSGVIGDVIYTEQYDVTLRSTEPLT